MGLWRVASHGKFAPDCAAAGRPAMPDESRTLFAPYTALRLIDPIAIHLNNSAHSVTPAKAGVQGAFAGIAAG